MYSPLSWIHGVNFNTKKNVHSSLHIKKNSLIFVFIKQIDMLKHINTIYTIVFVCIACYFSLGYAWWVFFVSLLLALTPLATSYFWFGLPILIILYNLIFGSTIFAVLCVACAPFHYIAFTSHVIHFIKDIWDID